MKNELKHLIQQAAGKPNYRDDVVKRTLYAFDATRQRYLPDAVVRAVDAARISRIMGVCYAHKIQVTARGAGSSLSGGPVPLQGGIVLDMAHMNRIIAISPEDQTAVVEPGVVNGTLQKALDDFGLFYPPDPASADFSTIGGNLAENAGGLRAVKYGVTGNYVLGLTAVLADGRIIKTGGQVMKNVVGYDLTRLLVGSEGTLAIITEATLKVIQRPEGRATLRAWFSSPETAATAVQLILQSGICPVALEFMDQVSIEAVMTAVGEAIPEQAGAMLLIELDGDREVVARQSQSVLKMLQQNHGREVELATKKEAMDRLWEVRRKLGPAVVRTNSGNFAEDIVVPLGRIAEMVRTVEKIAAKNALAIYKYGHAGDGNIHVNIMFDKTNPAESDRARQAVADVFHATLALGGSISGEHGVGNCKLDYLPLEVNASTIEVMQAVKRTFDPKGILNPGKAIPFPVVS